MYVFGYVGNFFEKVGCEVRRLDRIYHLRGVPSDGGGSSRVAEAIRRCCIIGRKLDSMIEDLRKYDFSKGRNV